MFPGAVRRVEVVLARVDGRMVQQVWCCFRPLSSSTLTTPPVSVIQPQHHRDDLTSAVTQEQAWLLRRPFTRSRFGVTHTPEPARSERSDKSFDWLAAANVARDRKHSPSLSNNYPSLHAGCQLANSSVIIPLLPVESGWQRAQYQSHSITLLLAFISATLSFTMKDSGFFFTLKTNVSACSARALLHVHTGTPTQGCVLENYTSSTSKTWVWSTSDASSQTHVRPIRVQTLGQKNSNKLLWLSSFHRIIWLIININKFNVYSWPFETTFDKTNTIVFKDPEH